MTVFDLTFRRTHARECNQEWPRTSGEYSMRSFLRRETRTRPTKPPRPAPRPIAIMLESSETIVLRPAVLIMRKLKVSSELTRSSSKLFFCSLSFSSESLHGALSCIVGWKQNAYSLCFYFTMIIFLNRRHVIHQREMINFSSSHWGGRIQSLGYFLFISGSHLFMDRQRRMGENFP